MIKIVICDDDNFDIEATKNLLTKYVQNKKDNDFCIKCYNSPFDLMSSIKEGEVNDIYLLDIIMTGIDGIDIDKQIREYQEHASIIYITMSEEYALESYKVNALQYLVKPIEVSTLNEVLDIAVERIQSDDEKLAINTKKGTDIILLHQIVFAEYSEHKIKYYMATGEQIESVVMREPFSEMAQILLKDKRFFRCHNAFIINMKHVCKMRKNEFVTQDGATIPISSSLHVQAKNAYFEYLLGAK